MNDLPFQLEQLHRPGRTIIVRRNETKTLTSNKRVSTWSTKLTADV